MGALSVDLDFYFQVRAQNFPFDQLVWFIGVYPQGPRMGILSNWALIVPPTHIESDQGDPLCSQA